MKLSFVLITFAVAGTFPDCSHHGCDCVWRTEASAGYGKYQQPLQGGRLSDLPPLLHFAATDEASLAYRYYNPTRVEPRGSIVLVHGSSASSTSMHLLAKAFAKAGYAAYALDVRGHGDSVPKGTIRYIGQLEDDLDSFTHAVSLPKPSTLLGFSSGGGFASDLPAAIARTHFRATCSSPHS